jgi:hypothetical protein
MLCDTQIIISEVFFIVKNIVNTKKWSRQTRPSVAHFYKHLILLQRSPPPRFLIYRVFSMQTDWTRHRTEHMRSFCHTRWHNTDWPTNQVITKWMTFSLCLLIRCSGCLISLQNEQPIYLNLQSESKWISAHNAWFKNQKGIHNI